MALIRIFSLISLSLLSTSCLDQYSPFAFWEKIEQERQMSANPSVIVAHDGRKISLGDDGKLVITASDAPLHDPATDSAELIYKQTCAVCHGKNGEGVQNNPARAFTDAQWQQEATNPEIAWIIKFGTMPLLNPSEPEQNEMLTKLKSRSSFKALTGGMAPSGGRVSAPLTDEQVEGLIEIIRNFK